jgi:4-amino-4-deoxy-L-arabinose transferase-like glycosyltransferase
VDVPVSVHAVPERTAATGARVRDLLILLAVAVPLLFAGLGVSMLDPDEGLYADIAKRMADGGDWLVPHFNGLPYLEKPPLYFWLTAMTLRLFGHDEAMVRLGAALAALGTVLLAWKIGRQLYGPEAGLRAGIVLATTAGYALYVRKASTDFVFVFCLALSLYGFLRDVDRPDRGRARFLVFYAGAALSVLAKGLIGLVFPVVILGATLLYVRRLRVRDLNLAAGSAVFLAVALPWHLAVAWREPGLTWFYVMDNQVLRFLGLRAFIEDDIPVSAVALLLLSFVWFFPWSVFALARPAIPAAGEAAAWRPVLAVWVLAVLVFFMASRSKLEYYALPAFPALAVLVGAAWTSGRDIGRWLVVGVAGCVIAGTAALVIGARLTPAQALDGLAELNVYYRIVREHGLGFPFASVAPFAALLQLLGATLVAGFAITGLCWWRGRSRAAFAAVTGVGVVITLLIVRLLYVVEPHHSAEAVAEAITSHAAAADVIVHEGSLEYSAALPFYTGRRVVVVNGTRGDLDIASRRPEAEGWFLETDQLARRWAGGERLFLVTQRPRETSVVAALPAGSTHLIGRFGSRWLYSNREK